MAILRAKNNDLSLRDRVSRLEGKVSVMIGLTIGTFLGVVGLLLERAFA